MLAVIQSTSQSNHPHPSQEANIQQHGDPCAPLYRDLPCSDPCGGGVQCQRGDLKIIQFVPLVLDEDDGDVLMYTMIKK